MALTDKQKAANWQEPAVPPVPIRHVTPVKIDLTDAGVQFEDGKITAITGTLNVVPYTSTQHPPLSAFFKTGPIECQLEDNHVGNTLSVKFTLQRIADRLDTPQGVALSTAPDVEVPPTLSATSDPVLDPVAAAKVAKAKTEPGFEEAVAFVQSQGYPRGGAESVVAEYGVTSVLADKETQSLQKVLEAERLKNASSVPEAAKTDGDSGAQPTKPV